MDKQGRLTRWDELEIGAQYEWVKYEASNGIHTLIEINKPEGFILMKTEGCPNGLHFYAWQNRFRKVQSKTVNNT